MIELIILIIILIYILINNISDKNIYEIKYKKKNKFENFLEKKNYDKKNKEKKKDKEEVDIVDNIEKEDESEYICKKSNNKYLCKKKDIKLNLCNSNKDDSIIINKSNCNTSDPAFVKNNMYNHPINDLITQKNTKAYDQVYDRDNNVLNNKLYPPLGRTERPQFDMLMNYINTQPGMFNEFTRGVPDTFRPLGYLTPVSGFQSIDNTLILYGRAKYPNSDMGEFYATSSSKISDIKLPINQYNSNIRKITDIPIDVSITGNILTGKYNFTELPKMDFNYPYI